MAGLPIGSNTGSENGLQWGLDVQRVINLDLSAVHIFGRSADIDISSGFVTVWNGSGSYTGFDAVVEENVIITSTSANDTLLGTGARTAVIFGLDGNYKEVVENINLNGVTGTISLNKYLRVNTVLILTAGTLKQNDGIVIIKQNISVNNVFSSIPVGQNRTLHATYTVPFGKVAYIYSGFATIAKKNSAVCEIRAKSRRVGSVFQIAEWFSVDSKASSYVSRDFKIPLTGAPAGTDIFIEANTDTNSIKVAAGLEFVLIDIT